MAKNKFVNELSESLMNYYSSEEVNDIIKHVIINLSAYELKDKCTDIATIDTDSIMMLKKFLATKRVEGKSTKTIDRYYYIISRMLNELGIAVSDIDVYALRLYLANLESRGLKDATVDGIRSILSSFFGWLHREQFISANPTSNLVKIKCGKVIRKEFSKTEIELIRMHCKTKRDRAIVEFLLSTGCRVSELTHTNISDVDFDKLECKLLGKGNKERIVFISDVCALHLKSYLNERTDNYEALFVGRGTDRMSSGGIRRILKRIEESSDVNDIFPHRFRHTTATVLINNGMHIQDVALLLGHNNINTTMTYFHSDIRKVKHNFLTKYN